MSLLYESRFAGLPAPILRFQSRRMSPFFPAVRVRVAEGMNHRLAGLPKQRMPAGAVALGHLEYLLMAPSPADATLDSGHRAL